MRAAGKWLAGILATVIAAVLVLVITQWWGPSDPQDAGPSGGASVTVPSTETDSRSGPATIYLNRDSGPAGTKVQVSGRGFAADEDVVIRFHVDVVAHTRADQQGAFAGVAVQVPSDWTFRGQFSFVATGQSSVKSAAREFEVT